jgi:aspartyl-tRNA synthetase
MSRYDLFLHDVTSLLQHSRINVLTGPLTTKDANSAKTGRGGCIKAINVKGMADLSKEDSEGIQRRVRDLGGKGVVEIRCGPEGRWRSPVEKHLTEQEKRGLSEALDVREGDLLLLCSGPERDDVSLILGGARCAFHFSFAGPIGVAAERGRQVLWTC